jgi:peptidoglycan/xylan/chitin deacetylase (PgdA/CDA1 family)
VQNIPSIPPTLPQNNNGPNSCENVTLESCNWSCGNCLRYTDVFGCTRSNHYALTFDDGPSNVTPRLLQILAEHNVRATFFLVGQEVIRYPEIVRQIVDQGHEVGVHTWSHTGLTTMSTDSIVGELHYTIQAIQQAAGVRPRYFRPPFGDHDDRVRAIAMGMGLTNVMWNFDSYDHGWDEYTPPRELADGILNFIDHVDSYIGTIMLQHDTTNARVSVMPFILNRIRERSLVPVTISQCLGRVSGTTSSAPSTSSMHSSTVAASSTMHVSRNMVTTTTITTTSPILPTFGITSSATIHFSFLLALLFFVIY